MHIAKHFVTIGHRQVHYRRCGFGPALLLLHTSLLSSAGLTDMILDLGTDFTVIAPDAPGHGLTSPLSGEISVERLADGLLAFMNSLDLEKPMIAGVGSGAHIALVFAARHGIKASDVICLDMPVWSEKDVSEIQGQHDNFINNKADGSHLIGPWHKLREQGYSVSVCQERFIDMLSTTGSVVPCDVEGVLQHYKGNGLHFIYSDAELHGETRPLLPDTCRNNLVPSQEIKQHIKTVLAQGVGSSGSMPPPPPALGLVPSPAVTRAYITVNSKEVLIHGRAGKAGCGSLLLLHEPGFSVYDFDDYMGGLDPDIALMVPDMPGQIIEPDFLSSCLDMLAGDAIIVTRGGGTGPVLKCLNRLDRPIGGLILDEPFLPEGVEDEKTRSFPKLPEHPSEYGEHLLTLYGRLQDRALCRSRYSDKRSRVPGAYHSESMKKRLLAALKAGSKYPGLFKSVCEENIEKPLLEASYPVVILSKSTHPSFAALRRLSQQATQAIILEQTGAEGVMAAMEGLGVRFENA